jgi:hypothetical protein
VRLIAFAPLPLLPVAAAVLFLFPGRGAAGAPVCGNIIARTHPQHPHAQSNTNTTKSNNANANQKT